MQFFAIQFMDYVHSAFFGYTLNALWISLDSVKEFSEIQL